MVAPSDQGPPHLMTRNVGKGLFFFEGKIREIFCGGTSLLFISSWDEHLSQPLRPVAIGNGWLRGHQCLSRH